MVDRCFASRVPGRPGPLPGWLRGLTKARRDGRSQLREVARGRRLELVIRGNGRDHAVWSGRPDEPLAERQVGGRVDPHVPVGTKVMQVEFDRTVAVQRGGADLLPAAALDRRQQPVRVRLVEVANRLALLVRPGLRTVVNVDDPALDDLQAGRRHRVDVFLVEGKRAAEGENRLAVAHLLAGGRLPWVVPVLLDHATPT